MHKEHGTSSPFRKMRARDLGIPFEGEPGPWNAITDVKGVEVGYTSITSGDPAKGESPIIRTGVTIIFPRGKANRELVFGGWFPLNGSGEMTGTTWLDESGLIEGPIGITNSHSVGTVSESIVKWQMARGEIIRGFSLPIVAETYDSLSDMGAFYVKQKDVFEALENAHSGPIAEGNVGGGMGATTFDFKGGTGTASRKVTIASSHFNVGILVQSNFGYRHQCTIAGVPVGKEIADLMYEIPENKGKGSSIIVVIATDAPLLPTQLKRLAKRAALGIARTGGIAEDSSGDIIVAFSTANLDAGHEEISRSVEMLRNEALNDLFAATAYATEEAIINTLVASEDMIGFNGVKCYALPHDRLIKIMKKYNRLNGF